MITVKVYEDVEQAIIATISLQERPMSDELIQYTVGEETFTKMIKRIVNVDGAAYLIALI